MKILALDVGGTAVKSAIIDECGNLSDFRLTASGRHPAEILTHIAVEVVNTYDDYDILAVSMTGQINHKTQTTLARSNGHELERTCFPVGKVLHEAVNHPVFVLNDANAAALGEATFGAGRNHPDFLCLTIGTGVGGGIIQNGSLFNGKNGIAGEFGHMVTHVGGRLCRCGRRGCFQQYASTTALMDAAKRVNPNLSDAKDFFECIRDDLNLQRTLDNWVCEIVEGLSSLTYIFNPSCFVLGGGVMERPDVLDMVRCQFKKRTMTSFSDVEIVAAELGNYAGMIGAAVFARSMMSNNK